MNQKKELELYLHIPFCVRKCEYCDFLSGPADEKTKENYVECLMQEIRNSKEPYSAYQVVSIFIGGGTPSLLSPEQILGIFDVVEETFSIREDAEITMEVNPGTVTYEKAKAWKQAGINRLSVGLQSAKNEELKMLGRIHTFEEFEDTFSMLREVGFTNLNVDLISAIPGQTVESWRETLCTVAELHPEHISAYSLIVEAGTPFYEKLEEGKNNDLPDLPDEDVERIIYEETEEILKTYGYHRYEISNYAKEGYACRHNEGYWRRTEYLGLGLGASSLIGHTRFHNVEDLSSYNKAVQSGTGLQEEIEQLSVDDEMEEFMFLGLRMMEGIRKTEFAHCFQKDIEEIYGTELRKLEVDGLLEVTEDTVRLTKRGIDISNYVFEQFLL